MSRFLNRLLRRKLFKRKPQLVIWIDKKRGLHTHPPIRNVDVTFDEHNHIIQIKHHSHDHEGVTVTSTAATHGHALPSGSTNCGEGGADSHTHTVTTTASASHTHAGCDLTFGSSDLGSPNWWVHTHTVTLTNNPGTSDAGFTNHSGHSWPGYSSYGFCGLCYDIGSHRHVPSTPVTFSAAGAVHTHTLTGKSTGNANTAAPNTAESHTHAFNVGTDQSGSHNHTWATTETLQSANCAYGRAHTHSLTSPLQNATHGHYLAGTTGDGGEAPPSEAGKSWGTIFG